MVKNKNQVNLETTLEGLNKYMQNPNLRALNRLLMIEKFGSVSKLLIYFSIIGAILVIISLFIPSVWVACWIYAIAVIILSGFVAARPGKRYNSLLVLGIFVALAFIPSIYMQALLRFNAPRSGLLSEYAPEPNISDPAILDNNKQLDQYENVLAPKLKSDYNIHDLRAAVLLFSKNADGCKMYFTSLTDAEFETLKSYVSLSTNAYKAWREEQVAWRAELMLSSQLKSNYGVWDLRNEVVNNDKTADQCKFMFNTLSEKNLRVLRYYVAYVNKYEDDFAPGQKPSNYQENPYENNTYVWDASGFKNSMSKITEFPFEQPELVQEYMLNLINVLNWIVFIACICYGGVAIASGFSLNFSEMFKRIMYITLAITVMTVIYSMFQGFRITLPSGEEVPIPTVWDTVGSAWKDMMSNLGLGMLDINGDWVVSSESVVYGLYGLIPLIVVCFCFGFGFALRKVDVKSMLFVKTITDENSVEVVEHKFSLLSGILIFALMIYVVGYFLTTAKPVVEINLLITIVFYVSALVILLLIGWKIFIVNSEKSIKSHIYSLIKWTLFGLSGLFLWFQVFQPALFALNIIDNSSALLTLSQDNSVFGMDIFKQLFLVAMPETLIFQVGFVGLGNWIRYRLGKGKIAKKEIKKMRAERWDLAVKYRNIEITEDSTGKENLKNLIKAFVLKRKADELEEKINERTVNRVPMSYFVASTIISAFIGAFFFSSYHCFRRGIDLWTWWQNPMYGMVYLGAGMLLSLVCFFSFPAAILVHLLNNLIAIWMAGG